MYVEKIPQSRQKSQQPYTHAPLPQTEDGRKYLLLPCRHHKKWGVAVFYRKKYISGDPCTRNFATTSEIYKGLIFEFASSHKVIKHTACNWIWADTIIMMKIKFLVNPRQWQWQNKSNRYGSRGMEIQYMCIPCFSRIETSIWMSWMWRVPWSYHP